MEIKWVNHASFLLRHKNISLLFDPWLFGYSFDQSWALLSESSFTWNDFKDVTHIFFSHEHPDHFSPPTLKKIPSDYRSNITIIYQETSDKRVIEFCTKLGFKEVIELPEDWFRISSEVIVFCGKVKHGDSWLAVKTPEKVILNINDCIFLEEKDLAKLKSLLSNLDLLITQFSIASWWGNPENSCAWESAAKSQLSKIALEMSVLSPKQVLLSASYIYFCHEENAYINQYVNRVSSAFDFVTKLGGHPIVLYPGENWNVGEPHSSIESIKKYTIDENFIMNNSIRVKSTSIPVPELEKQAKEFINRLRKKNSILLLLRLATANIFIKDYNDTFKLDLKGFRLAKINKSDCHINLSSSALSYCFKFDWGGETLMINGRFSKPKNSDLYIFLRWFSIASDNSRNIFYDLNFYKRKALDKLDYRFNSVDLKKRF